MIDINKILLKKENLYLEAKSAENKLPKSFWESYSAFANTDGGIILLGVKEDTKTKKLQAIGVTKPETIISDIWNTLNNRQKVSANILLNEQIYTIEFHNKTLIVIEVPRAERYDRPVFIGQSINQGTYRRNNEGDYKCSNNEIKSMLRDQSDKSSDSLILENHDLKSLCDDSIKKYRNLFNNLKPNHVWASLTVQEFLLKIGAARISQKDGEIHPTLAGLIFFGYFNEIINELPYYFLDYREHLNKDIRWTDRVCSSDSDWSGNIFDFYFKIINKLTADVKKPFKLNKNLQRVDDTMIHASIREALANALIHADYYGTQGIVIDKTPNSITISNPGNFRIPIKEAIAGGISDARNSRIFNLFSLIEVGERSGMGLCNLFNIWEQNNLMKPVVTETIIPTERVSIELNFVKTNIVRQDNGNVRQWSEDVRQGVHQENITQNVAQEGANVTQENIIVTQINNNVRQENKNVRQTNKDVVLDKSISNLIIKKIKGNDKITLNEIAKEAGVSERTIRRYIKSMPNVKYIGSGYSGHWEIKN